MALNVRPALRQRPDLEYVASGWLMGEDPPAFDTLAWNETPPRIAPPHALVLTSRHCIRRERARSGRDGARGRAAAARPDAPRTSTCWPPKEDHTCVPWTSAYKATQLFTGAVRYVLYLLGSHRVASSTPPNPKGRHWTGNELRPTRMAWLAADAARRLLVARPGRPGSASAPARGARPAAQWAATRNTDRSARRRAPTARALSR
jgi:hypothetical protein